MGVQGKSGVPLLGDFVLIQVVRGDVVTRIESHPRHSGADAFGRLRVSPPFTTFENRFIYNLMPLLYNTQVTGSATIVQVSSDSLVRLRCTTASGDRAILQSKTYHRYQPGKGSVILMTGVLGAAKVGVRKRLGFFDADNGLFFEQDSDGLALVRRSSVGGTVTDHRLPQSTWNLDKFDGSGPSGVTLDPAAIQIFVIDFQWLGASRVRWGFVTPLGEIAYAHIFTAANVLAIPYMALPDLPTRYEIENLLPASSNTDLLAVCQSVSSEGAGPVGLLTTGFGRGANSVSVTTRRAILSMRLKGTFGGKVNRGQVVLKHMHLLGSVQSLFELVRNGVLGGTPSWTSAGANSLVEFDIAGTTVTGGDIVETGLLANTGTLDIQIEQVPFVLPLSLDIPGTTSDVLSLVVTSLGAGSTTFAEMTVAELY